MPRLRKSERLPGRPPPFPLWLQLVRSTLVVVVLLALAHSVDRVAVYAKTSHNDRLAQHTATCSAVRALTGDAARLRAYEIRANCPLLGPLPPAQWSP